MLYSLEISLCNYCIVFCPLFCLLDTGFLLTIHTVFFFCFHIFSIPSMCQNSKINVAATASFHILSNPIFTSHPVTDNCIVYSVDSIMK